MASDCDERYPESSTIVLLAFVLSFDEFEEERLDSSSANVVALVEGEEPFPGGGSLGDG